ncbi:MAG: rhodanese-like domain-containing protein [Pirellula sp.]
MKNISASELSKLINSGEHIDLIDVRTPIEFRALHVTNALNVPLDRLDPSAVRESGSNSSDPLYVVCRSGGRSRQACEKLLAAGVANVVNVEGGTMACASAGAPVIRGKSAIPLNCQVQIITGVTVAAGTIAAIATANLYWLSLPMVMGAGLVFSGLTNTCAMGTMLARMPWNQVKPEATVTSNATSKTCSSTASGCCN